MLSLSSKLLLRNWRAGELRILSAALFIAVVIVTVISVFTASIQATLIQESNRFLAADKVIASSSPLRVEWQRAAKKYQLKQARTATFPSMITSGENVSLATVKAVTDSYPLVGDLVVSTVPFAVNDADLEQTNTGPPAGEAWLDSRLLALLDAEIGDSVTIGFHKLKLSRVILAEPDRSGGFASFNPRFMIHYSDLVKTGVVLPGSRINYRWLLAGSESEIAALVSEIKPSFTPSDRVIDIQSAQQQLARNLDRGEKFLLISAVMAVLLAGVAIAIAARQFFFRQVDQVALIKSFGVRAKKIRQIYALQLLLLTVATSILGMVVSYLVQSSASYIALNFYGLKLESPPLGSYFYGIITGFICVFFFVIPSLWYLPTVPPIKIFRREMVIENIRPWVQHSFSLLAVCLLIALFSQNLAITVSLISVIFILVVVIAGLSLIFLRLSRRVGARAGNRWLLALSNLSRNKGHTVSQITAFSITLMLLFTLIIARSSLISEWELQLPENTPNHFLINLAPNEVEPMEQLFNQEKIEYAQIYPMVRGRISFLNGAEPSEEIVENNNVFRREVNLTWASSLGPDNKLVGGSWWDDYEPVNTDVIGVSIEEELAESLRLKLGDEIIFNIGGFELKAQVASLRSLSWDSMQPNFYFIFEPGTLADFSPSYITSVYIPPEQKTLINTILKRYPTVVVLELDKLIEQIKAIVARVTMAVEVVLWATLLCGVLVLIASVNASMTSRMQQAGLLRALGSGKRLILDSIAIEYLAVGLIAGLLGIIGAEIALFSIQHYVLDIKPNAHYELWFVGVFFSMVFIAIIGLFGCRKIVNTPPMNILREIE